MTSTPIGAPDAPVLVQTDYATEAFSHAFIQAYMGVAEGMIDDARVSPMAMAVGAMNAHTHGLASAIASVERVLGLEPGNAAPMDEALIADCVRMIRETLAVDRPAGAAVQ